MLYQYVLKLLLFQPPGIQLFLNTLKPILHKWFVNIYLTDLPIKDLGFIKTFLLFLNILEFFLKYTIFAFIFFLGSCVIFIYINGDIYIYLPFLFALSILLIGIYFLFFSVNFLIEALEAWLKGNFFLFKLNFIFFIFSLLFAIILISYGLHTLHMIPWTYGSRSLRDQAQDGFGPGNNGTGNGSGGGGGNNNPEWLGTASQRDSKEEERMYKKKEEVLFHHKDLYTKTIDKANKNLRNLRSKKKRNSKIDHIDTTYDKQIEWNIQIREATWHRLRYVKLWIKWLKDTK